MIRLANLLYRGSPQSGTHPDSPHTKLSNGNLQDRFAPPASDQTWNLETWGIPPQISRNYTLNCFLIFVPIGIIAGSFEWNPTAVFILNLLAMVPLAAILSIVTEELAANAGQTVGALLNATFGNAPELIVGYSDF